MNKKELVNYVAETTELTKKDSGKVVDAVLEGITEALKRGEKVSLIGFGNFEVRERAARKGQNPKKLAELKEQGVSPEEAKKQSEIDIPASKVPAFKPGKHLKEHVNK